MLSVEARRAHRRHRTDASSQCPPHRALRVGRPRVVVGQQPSGGTQAVGTRLDHDRDY